MDLTNVQKVTRPWDYCDLDLDFTIHPGNNDVSMKYGVEALKRSVRNLILTNFYDRKFNPSVGCNAQKLLFENITPMTANFLRDQMLNVLANFEPRVEVNEIVVQMNIDENGYNSTITFTPLNSVDPVVVDIFLQRIR